MSRVMYQVRPGAIPTPEVTVRGRQIPAGMYTWRNGGGFVHKMASIHRRAFVGVAAEVGSSSHLGRNISVEDKAVVDGYAVGHTKVKGAARTEPGSYIRDGHIELRGNVIVRDGTCLSGSMTLDGSVELRGVNIRGDNLTIIGPGPGPLIIDETILPEPITLGPGWVITDLLTLRLLAMAMDSQYESGRVFTAPPA